MSYARTPLAIRIWRFVDKTDGCWIWTGARNPQGYGQVRLDSQRKGPAHRAMYELLVGPIPEGLVIDHLCSNPPCVNPDHLEPVTQRVNLLAWFEAKDRSVDQ